MASKEFTSTLKSKIHENPERQEVNIASNIRPKLRYNEQCQEIEGAHLLSKVNKQTPKTFSNFNTNRNFADNNLSYHILISSFVFQYENSSKLMYR